MWKSYGGEGIWCIVRLYMSYIWVRNLGKWGNSEAVTLPAAALNALKWQCGDRLLVKMHSDNEIRITKFEPHLYPKRVREAIVSKVIK